MTVRPIVITGEPVLHQRAQPVESFDDELKTLVADMFETMDAAHGVGLAAPQIGVGLRIFTWQMDNDDGVPARGVIVNPYVTPSKPLAGATPTRTTRSRAACRSRARPSRSSAGSEPASAASTLDGNEISFEATGWFARMLQHEYDHLNGFLYVDRLNDKWAQKAKKAVKAQRLGHARAIVDAGRRPLTPSATTPTSTTSREEWTRRIPRRTAREGAATTPRHRRRRPHRHRQVRPRPRPRRGLRRRGRQRRRLPALPRDGHRHRQAAARRAARHPAPPARRPRRHPGGERRRLPVARPRRPRRDRRARPPPRRRRRLGSLRAGGPRPPRDPAHRRRRAPAARGGGRPRSARRRCCSRLRERDPAGRVGDRAQQHPPHRAGPRGHRADRPPVLGDDAHPRVRPADRRSSACGRPGPCSTSASRRGSSGCGARGCSTRCGRSSGVGLREGRTAIARDRLRPGARQLDGPLTARAGPGADRRPDAPGGSCAGRSRGSAPTRASPGSTRGDPIDAHVEQAAAVGEARDQRQWPAWLTMLRLHQGPRHRERLRARARPRGRPRPHRRARPRLWPTGGPAIGGDGVIRVVPTDAADRAGRAGTRPARRAGSWTTATPTAAPSEMCGNGTRVFAAYLRREGLETADEFAIATRAGIKHVRVERRRVRGRPRARGGSPTRRRRARRLRRPRPPRRTATRSPR